jgi:hypothetical protein
VLQQLHALTDSSYTYTAHAYSIFALHASQWLQNRPIAVAKLGCLDREATKQFVTGYLQCDSEAFPSKVFDFIWEASQGNPMVCEEVHAQ